MLAGGCCTFMHFWFCGSGEVTEPHKAGAFGLQTLPELSQATVVAGKSSACCRPVPGKRC